MSGVKNIDRSPLFPLLQIEIEKYRGRWRIFVGEKRVGKTFERKVQAIQAARTIRRAWIESIEFGKAESTCAQIADQAICPVPAGLSDARPLR